MRSNATAAKVSKGDAAALDALAAEVARLRDHSVTFRGDVVETAVCRFIIAIDPDGSEFLIHQRKRVPDAARTI